MKISHVETFLFNPGSTRNLLFCRVETEDGVHGWGEAYVTMEKEKAVAEYLQAMIPHLLGRSPFNIRHTGQVLFDDFVIRRSSIGFLSAWSAIEMSLWDIVGKVAGQPLYNLLGGASRERIRVYANGWGDEPGTIDENIERALKVKEQGYTALKFDPVPGPWRNFIHREDEDFAVDYVRRMREALGPKMEIHLDMHRRLAPFHAIRLGRRLAEYDITCYEEPCLSDNIELVAEVRRNVPIPVVTGETLYTKESLRAGFREARRRHPQSGYLRYRRHLGHDGHRRHGAAPCGGLGPSQQQQHASGPRRDGARLCGHPQLRHSRVLH